MWMTRVAVHNPVFATMVMLALVVLGLFSYNRLRVEQMPDVTLPFVVIGIEYPGASPEGVESDITKPVEQVMNTLPGVKMIRSNSFEGFSNVFVEFRLDVDPERAVQGVRDKMAQLRPSLPRDAREPNISRVDTDNQQPVVYAVLLSDKRSLRELTFLAEKVVKQSIERVGGVGQIELSGTARRQIEIRLKPERMTQAGVGAEQIMQALRTMNLNAPVGEVRGRSGDAVVRVDGRMREPREFEQLVVANRQSERGVVQVRLGQVAEVADAERERTQLGRFNGVPGIGVSIFKVQDANLVEVGRGVLKQIDAVRKQLPADVQLKVWYASSDWVQASVDNVKKTIFEGAALTVLIVFLFLASWRSTVITGLTLPIAVISTFLALYAFGFSLNYLTLMALSLCIGLLIDDAIVVRENISRHQLMGKTPMQAALDGTNEIGLAVLATTFSIVAVFVPIAFMSGVIGKFFYAFGITVAVAVLISLFVSFTLDPMLSAYWNDPEHDPRYAHLKDKPRGVWTWPVVGRLLGWFDRFMGRLEARYERTIGWALAHKKSTVAIAFGSLLASFALLPLVGSEFIPEADQGFTSMRIQLPPGGTLAYADAKARRAEAIVREFAEIELSGVEVSAKSINFQLKLVDRKQRKRTQKQIEQALRERMATIPGLELQIGWNRPIYVALMGNNDELLAQYMNMLRDKVAAIAGIADLETSMKPGTPALSVRLLPQAAELGITHAQVGQLLRTLVNGEEAGTWLAPDGENYALVVRLPKELRTNIEDLRGVNVTAGRMRADGTPMVVALEQVATISRVDSPEVIKRQDLQRRVALYAGVKDRTMGEVSAEVKKAVKEVEGLLPAGLRFDVGGQQQELDDSFKAAVGALGMAVIFLYFILASQFGSFLQPLAIMASLPLALIGVVLALLATRTTMNIFSMIGIIMLMGLVTKNAILLVDFANRAQREEGLPQDAALARAGRVRLRPILMTTAAMVMGMLPLALGLGEGSEQQAPMGRAIIGGVITSTLLTLVLVPVLYSWLDRAGAKKLKAAAKVPSPAEPGVTASTAPQGAE
jgi:hydrophobe/amphiphile efflux-1 (HAE1) family protein